MLRVSCLLVLTLGVVVLSTPLPPKHKDVSHATFNKRSLLEKRVMWDEVVKEKRAPLEKRVMWDAPVKEKRTPLEKRVMWDEAVKEKRAPLEKRVMWDAPVKEKRAPLEKRLAVDSSKRDKILRRAVAATFQAPSVTYSTGAIPLKADASLQYYTGFTPVNNDLSVQYQTGFTPLNYYVQSDGTIVWLQPGQVAPQVQISQPIVQQPTSGSGSLLGFLQKPLNAGGDIIKLMGDTESAIVSLPFNVVDTAIQGVGLGDTGVGQVATGILDAGKGLATGVVQGVSAIKQAPFRIAANLAGAIEE